MVSGRNNSCPCGSGKKYKKCCLSLEGGRRQEILSENLKGKLNAKCWFHGTAHDFDSWLIPPPPKPGEDLVVPHTAIFFTSDLEFAKKAGNKIARVSLSGFSRILDTTVNYEASEKLRTLLTQNQLASKTLNIEHDFWHRGWRTGSVLRMAYTDPSLDVYIQQMTENISWKFGLPLEAASAITQHNISRGLIELICTSAKKLGFDAIFGHEVDRHSHAGRAIAQPWLAVLSKGVVSKPEWVQDLL